MSFAPSLFASSMKPSTFLYCDSLTMGPNGRWRSVSILASSTVSGSSANLTYEYNTAPSV